MNVKENPKLIWVGILIAGAILLAILGFFLFKQANVLAKPVIPTDYFVTPPDHYAGRIGTLQALATEDPEHFEQRLALAAKEATLVAGGRLRTPATRIPPEIAEATLQSMEHERPTGILDYIPSTSHTFREQNAWNEKVGDGYVLVLAGYFSTKPEYGVVMVRFEQGKNIHNQTYLTPNPVGAIKIINVKGLRLVLVADNKDILYFDVPGEIFVSSLDEIVPVSTGFTSVFSPAPTATPLAYP
jgi:hypothetical protein